MSNSIRFKKKSVTVFLLSVFLLSGLSFAQDQAQQPEAPVKHKKSKGKLPREKEAEGTQAPNRFDSETVIKSQHKGPDGQPLEVETD